MGEQRRRKYARELACRMWMSIETFLMTCTPAKKRDELAPFHARHGSLPPPCGGSPAPSA